MRFILGFIGAVFAAVLLISFFSNLATYFNNPPAPLASDEFHKEPKEIHFASDGPFGQFDKRQLQRGFQVYSEVCSACHSLKMVSFRDLKGLGYNEAEIKKIASDWKTQVPSINPDTGEAATRKALPSDNFPAPFANEVAARAANNNALPPDLSLMTKAREGGAAYVYSLITGYANQAGYKNEKGEELLKKFPDAKTPKDLTSTPISRTSTSRCRRRSSATGRSPTLPGNPAPTVDQMARDVAAFLVWTAEPNLESRHAAGLAVAIFLLVASILGYFAYRQIWYEAKRAVRVTGALDPENQAKTRRAKAKQGVAG